MNEKLNTMNGIGVASISADSLEIKKDVEDTSKDIQESNDESKTESNIEKHVVTYIGSSEYIDATGHKWHSNDEMTYTSEEYDKRSDIHFMVNYGEMKHTIVTI